MRKYMDHYELDLVTFDMRMCLHIVFHQSRGGLYVICIHDLNQDSKYFDNNSLSSFNGNIKNEFLPEWFVTA